MSASPLVAPKGFADVATSPSSLSRISNAAGTTFTVTVNVEPNTVEVDAAAVLLAYDPAYLEVRESDIAGGNLLDTELAKVVDAAQGTVFYAAGKLGAPWPSSTFALASVTFRVKTAPPAPQSITLLTGAANATDVAANGFSVLNTVRGTTVSFSAPSGSGGGSSGGGSSGGGSSSGGTSSGSSGGSAVPPAPTVAPAPTAVPSASSAQPAVPNVPASLLVAQFPAGSVPPLPPAVQVAAASVATAFEQFYAERQGLRVLGNTLVASRSENGVLVQYFEKGRMEDHPDEPNAAWRFQYGLLVDELVAAGAPLPVGGDASTLTYAAIQQLIQPAARVAPPEGFVGGFAVLPDGAVFIPFSAALAPESGHVVPQLFWDYVNDLDLFPGGWLHDVGLPVTEPVEAIVDKGPEKGRRIMVQAFQRTILTYDPINPEGWQIERANVGTDYARAFPWKFGG